MPFELGIDARCRPEQSVIRQIFLLRRQRFPRGVQVTRCEVFDVFFPRLFHLLKLRRCRRQQRDAKVVGKLDCGQLALIGNDDGLAAERRIPFGCPHSRFNQRTEKLALIAAQVLILQVLPAVEPNVFRVDLPGILFRCEQAHQPIDVIGVDMSEHN